MTGPSERDEIAAVAEALSKANWGPGSDLWEHDLDNWRAIAEALLPWLAERDHKTATDAVEKVAREWQYGGWTILTAPPPAGAIPSLALGQRVTDWLRARIPRSGR